MLTCEPRTSARPPCSLFHGIFHPCFSDSFSSCPSSLPCALGHQGRQSRARLPPTLPTSALSSLPLPFPLWRLLFLRRSTNRLGLWLLPACAFYSVSVSSRIPRSWMFSCKLCSCTHLQTHLRIRILPLPSSSSRLQVPRDASSVVLGGLRSPLLLLCFSLLTLPSFPCALLLGSADNVDHSFLCASVSPTFYHWNESVLFSSLFYSLVQWVSWYVG